MAAIKREVWTQLVGLSVEDATALSDVDMAQSLAASDFKEGVASFLERRPPNFAPLQRGWATVTDSQTDRQRRGAGVMPGPF